MHLVSNISTTTSPTPAPDVPDVPVFIFKHGEKRKFLPRPKTYDDMVRVVKRKFDLGADAIPTFEVKTLVVCKGNSIELDESAYPAMMCYLDEIEVMTSGAPAQVGGHARAEAEAEATPLIDAGNDTAAKTENYSSKRKDKGKEKDQTASTSKTSKSPAKPRVSSEKKRDIKPVPKALAPDVDESPETPPKRRRVPMKCASAAGVARSTTAPQDPHNLFDDDIPVEYASPAKNRRDYVETDREDDATCTADKAGNPSSKADAESGHSKTQSSEWEHVVSPVQTSKNLAESHNSYPPKVLQSTSKAPEYDSESVKVKKEKVQKPASSTSTAQAPKKVPSKTAGVEEPIAGSSEEIASTQDTTNAGDDEVPDVRFKVYIEGPEPAHRAEFMTRSRHAVRKVLTKACQTFGIDSASASLLLIEAIERDGENFEELFKCDINSTVGQVGLYANATLRVVLQDVDGGDEEEEEEEEGYY